MNNEGLALKIIRDAESRLSALYKRPVKLDHDLLFEGSRPLYKANHITMSFKTVFGVSMDDLLQRVKGSSELSLIKALYCYYLYSFTITTYKEIGNLLGKDHSTIINKVNRVRDLMSIDDTATLHCMKKVNAQLKKISNDTEINPPAVHSAVPGL